MNCPSCGAELEVDDRFAHLVVCESCDSSVILDARALRVAGKMATLAPPRGVFYLGATGSLGKREFRVLGRVRYGYGSGYWDEWFLSLDDGTVSWISEDEDEMVLESCTQHPSPPFAYDHLAPGERIVLGGQPFTVTERDVATCEGGAGQLPFMVVPGEQVPFADLTGQDLAGTIEFDDDGVKVFVGKVISPEAVRLDRTREEAGVGPEWSAERAPGAGGKARIVKGAAGNAGLVKIKCTSCGAPQDAPSEGAATHACQYCGAEIDLQARQVDCPGCAAVIPVKAREAAMCVVCPKCHGQLDISRDQPSLIADLAKKRGPSTPLKLGKKGTLRGTQYEVVGRIHLVERDAWGSYPADEFFLRPTGKGEPRWLVHEKGHWTLGREVKAGPGLPDPRRVYQKMTFSHGGDSYKVFEIGEGMIHTEFVEGELSYVAQVGDRAKYVDCIAPPKMLSAEWTETELEWFEAEYLEVAEVEEAFGISAPGPEGVYCCQPYIESEFRSELPVLLTFFSLLMLFMIFGAYGSGQEIFRASVPLAQIDKQEYITEPFQVTAPTILEVEADSGVDNSWVYVQFALVDAEEHACVEGDVECSYYHGYEGGESWSEGSRSDYSVFTVDKSGSYKLLVFGQGGTGNAGTTMRHADGPLKLVVYQDIQLARYYVILFFLSFPLAVFLWTGRARFEARRWAPVTDDDDD